MEFAHAGAFLLVLAAVAILWHRVRRLEGCVRWLVRQSAAHHADADALAETIDDVAADGAAMHGSEEWEGL